MVLWNHDQNVIEVVNCSMISPAILLNINTWLLVITSTISQVKFKLRGSVWELDQNYAWYLYIISGNWEPFTCIGLWNLIYIITCTSAEDQIRVTKKSSSDSLWSLWWQMTHLERKAIMMKVRWYCLIWKNPNILSLTHSSSLYIYVFFVKVNTRNDNRARATAPIWTAIYIKDWHGINAQVDRPLMLN